MLHSLLLWLAQAESRLGAVNVGDPSTPRSVLLEHRVTLTVSAQYFIESCSTKHYNTCITDKNISYIYN